MRLAEYARPDMPKDIHSQRNTRDRRIEIECVTRRSRENDNSEHMCMRFVVYFGV
jgi:hypothetical protein